MEEKIQLKWYEKRQGIKLKDKIKSEQKKKEFLEKQNLKKNSASEKKQLNSKRIHSIQKSKFVKPLEDLFSAEKIPEDAKKIIEEFDKVVESTHPLNSKQKLLLPKQIRSLSHFLTDERGERRLGYMNQTVLLSAYVHYYTWWNLVRLVRLFSNIDKKFFDVKDSSVFLDLGSGPLTVPLALFLSRPELRKKHITFYCLDISQQALAFGENIFLSVAARLKCEPWKIVRVKGELGSSVKEKADFIISANLFNELCDDFKNPPDFLAKKYTEQILSYLKFENENARYIIVEPGDPRSARLVSLMRDSFMRRGFFPVSPCTHFCQCPMDGKKGGKWCNYAFKTDDAPAELKKLSEKSELPKERAVLSFVAFQKSKDGQIDGCGCFSDERPEFISMRITSELIKLPGGRSGYYACSEKGLLLVVTSQQFLSGQKIRVLNPQKKLPIDSKSGAYILEL
ncbi:small ribosomal subunit Rsm22 family protein [uncultured Treponema sp.]|uniref:small ribosomal subunit Rsm22 family protein n=1 Tax=uncultured Treponema sp. TaxID=162155 RepID=UPI0025D2316A|nr:small ribosomal subunit Rsm22 family protein [uncultured Treponema sp.]